MVIQNDGNLVIYAASGRALWSSYTPPAPPAPVIRDVLNGGGEIRSGQQLVSSDGGSRAAMQGDGNFVVYRGGEVRFSTGTSGSGNRLAMQTDGNAVVYSSGGAVRWQSGTSGNPGARMVMQNDGNLVIYSGNRAVWSSYTPPAPPAPVISDTLNSGNELGSGRLLRSSNGSSEAIMQGDGNFVVYSNGGPRWSAGTSGAGNRLVMQGDGNAVIYSGSRAVWQSGTSGNGGARMVMQNDGNLVIYSTDGRALWQSNQPAPAPAPQPGPAPAPGPSQPGNPGNAVNCDDFSSQAAAQAWFNTYYPYYGDVAGLDRDGDLVACE
ncbi:excalibur calcium-binding domain-containing protein [Rathayibacter sp. VKM Ac-2835]|nr:excalibur calcium-binding domain-containing protein [Rathayibacter sp. VKM Ac-2835]